MNSTVLLLWEALEVLDLSFTILAELPGSCVTVLTPALSKPGGALLQFTRPDLSRLLAFLLSPHSDCPSYSSLFLSEGPTWGLQKLIPMGRDISRWSLRGWPYFGAALSLGIARGRDCRWPSSTVPPRQRLVVVCNTTHQENSSLSNINVTVSTGSCQHGYSLTALEPSCLCLTILFFDINLFNSL